LRLLEKNMFFGLSKLMRPGAKAAARSRSGVLSALLRNKTAATLPMVAMAIFPMVGIIGGGVDMARVYMVKSRLQQACDAGALAARRAMTGTTLTSAASTQGQNFFANNLRNGKWGATGVNVVYTANSEGAVNGVAQANVPMTLMRVFGTATKALQVTCQAQLNVANNDVLFVLDVTGSMACVPADSSSTCTTYAGTNITTATDPDSVTEKASSRMDGLRAAVEDFAVILAGATSSSARLRIGFISYSSGVNLGTLPAVGVSPLVTAAGSNVPILTAATHLRTGNFTYPTRVALFNTPDVTTTEEIYGSNISGNNCQRYGTNTAFTGFTPTPAATGVTYSPKRHGSDTTPPFSGSSTAQCRRNRHYDSGKFRWTSNSYTNDAIDISTYVQGTAVPVVTGTIPSTATVNVSGTYDMRELGAMQTAGTASGMTVTSTTWDGCVLERVTGPDDMTTAPTALADTRWTPIWKEITYTSGGTAATSAAWNLNYVCPKASLALTPITTASLGIVRNYVNVLNGVQTTPTNFLPHGRTYHDIGMVWAARLMQPSGMFSGWHGPAPNNRPVTRSIIFMTDGDMDTSNQSYSTFGIDSRGDAAHNTRFLAACTAARAAGINVYVISFAQTLTADLIACAADSTRDFEASNTAELQDAFSTIAQRIAELRLTQ
jgi:Flp pilus assembly protein TadG